MASKQPVILSLLLLSACAWNAVSQEEEEEDKVLDDDTDSGPVVTLTKGNFHRIVDQEDVILVEFYAPWWASYCDNAALQIAKL